MKPNTLKLLFSFIPLLSFFVVQKFRHCQLMPPWSPHTLYSCQFDGGIDVSMLALTVHYEASELNTESRLFGGSPDPGPGPHLMPALVLSRIHQFKFWSVKVLMLHLKGFCLVTEDYNRFNVGVLHSKMSSGGIGGQHNHTNVSARYARGYICLALCDLLFPI